MSRRKDDKGQGQQGDAGLEQLMEFREAVARLAPEEPYLKELDGKIDALRRKRDEGKPLRTQLAAVERRLEKKRKIVDAAEEEIVALRQSLVSKESATRAAGEGHPVGAATHGVVAEISNPLTGVRLTGVREEARNPQDRAVFLQSSNLGLPLRGQGFQASACQRQDLDGTFRNTSQKPSTQRSGLPEDPVSDMMSYS